ncbi:MAG: mobilization protein MbpA [Bacteroidota bacterium]
MKTSFIKFRCSLYEKKLLKIKAKRAGISLSEFCRRSAFDDKIIERLSEEQIDVYKMLVKYHNNFKVIGNMYRKQNPRLTEKVVQLADEIKTHLNNFKK